MGAKDGNGRPYMSVGGLDWVGRTWYGYKGL